MNKIKSLFNRVRRTGLRDDEGVLDKREVILLNSLVASIPFIMAIYIPVEVVTNGWQMLPATIAMIAIMSAPLYFHYKRWFRFTQYYAFIIVCGFIVTMAVLVGNKVNNHIALIPGMLLGLILFKHFLEKVFVFAFTIVCYAAQQYLPTVIPAAFPITHEQAETFTVIFYVLAVFLTFLMGLYFFNLNNDYEKIIIHQKESLAEKNKEVTDSITYAKRIQTALLPSEHFIKHYFPESFILYKPKDIVAGDFYWMEIIDKKDSTLILIAAADCTGHGVPGAMVSVICNNALNRSVREFELTDPGKILDKTREIVISEFEKSDEDVKDGMDISLLAIEQKAGNFFNAVWAGANNSLFVVRNGMNIEYKPNKQPIGKFANPTNFTSQSIDVQSGDMIYLFTDGYSDQFGGDKNKKIKSSVFKDLLTNGCMKEPVQQKIALDQYFENWRGTLEQNDDVCVIGIKL